MTLDLLKKTLLFAALAVVQVLILNNIHLFGVATPLVSVWFVLLMRRNASKWAVLLWSFALGLVVDAFSNTPGVGAAAMTLAGALQPYVLAPFIPRDAAEDFQPTLRLMNAAPYFYYSLLLVLVYNLAFYSLEMFSFFNWLYWIECVAGSTALTEILILVLENMRRK